MSAFHIRVTEPGIAASFEIKAGWADDTPAADVRKLLTEAYAAAMERVAL